MPKNSSKKETIIERFAREKREWRDLIEELTIKMRNINNLAELEVNVFSQRQIILEYIHKLMEIASAENRTYKKLLRDRIIYYTESYDIKLDKPQKVMFSEVDLAGSLGRKDLLFNHLDYLRSTLETIDKMIYGIKWRIQIEQFKTIKA